MKKVILVSSIVVVLLCALMVFIACDNENNANPSTPSNQEPTAINQNTLYLNGNGGYFDEMRSISKKAINYETLKEEDLNVIPKKYGYVFEGYGATADATDPLTFQQIAALNNGATIYAIWDDAPIVRYTINYEGSLNEQYNVDERYVYTPHVLFAIEPDVEEVSLEGIVTFKNALSVKYYSGDSTVEVEDIAHAKITGNNQVFQAIATSLDGIRKESIEISFHKKQKITIKYILDSTSYENSPIIEYMRDEPVTILKTEEIYTTEPLVLDYPGDFGAVEFVDYGDVYEMISDDIASPPTRINLPAHNNFIYQYLPFYEVIVTVNPIYRY